MATMPQTRPLVKPAPAGTCRLTLTIRDTDYRVRPIETDPRSGIARAFRLTKQAGQGDVYDVALTEHGATCDCPDYVFKRDGFDPRGCKHVRALRAHGLLPRLSLELRETDFVDESGGGR